MQLQSDPPRLQLQDGNESLTPERPAAATADEDEKEPCKIAMKKHKSGKGKLATAGKIKSKDEPRKTAKTKHKDCKDKKPCVGVEWSRSRVQCRSGKAGPGQNVAFRFGPDCTYKTVKEAMAAANKWLAKERSRRGL